MEIEVLKATVEQKPLLTRLLEFYSYDFTEFCDFDLDENGYYGYDHLSLYWTEPTRFPYLIYVDKKVAGFILIQQESSASNTQIWDISEFFILKKYRRHNIGTSAAFKIWKLFYGLWQVRVLTKNYPACSFWKHAIEKFAPAPPSMIQVVIKDADWIIYSFESKSK